MEGYENKDTQVEQLLRQLNLKAGEKVNMLKVSEDGTSHIKSGTDIVGILDYDITLGRPISLSNGKANTTAIENIEEREGVVYIKTKTSLYELIKKPKSIITAKGSKYTYLDDGRTQRYKKVSNETSEPQDLLVFIPPWEKIRESAISHYPHIFKGIENQVQFEQVVLDYMHKGKTIRPVNKEGKVLETTQKLAAGEEIFLAFINKEDGNVFHLPVSKRPKIGWLTFDTRLYTDESGAIMRERHIGNAVTRIEY